MDENPYQPPLVAAPSLAEEQTGSDRRRRPLGIWILAGLHTLAGLLVGACALILLRELLGPGDRLRNLPDWFGIVFGLMTFLSLGTSIGIWLGTRWGWWLTTFYYVWVVLGSVSGILLALARTEEVNAASIVLILPPSRLIVFAIHVLILLYLSKGNVRAYFRLKSLRLGRALLLLAIIAIAVLTAIHCVAYFQPVDGS